MKKYILHDHITGEFWETYSTDELKELVQKKVEMKRDIEDFSAYKADKVDLILTEKTTQELTIGKYTNAPY